jgi:hypothetical protein
MTWQHENERKLFTLYTQNINYFCKNPCNLERVLLTKDQNKVCPRNITRGMKLYRTGFINLTIRRPMWRSGGNMNMSVCIGSGCFYV